MKVTFLGTGTSQGVPVIACKCNICQSKDPRDKRLRSSIVIEIDEKVLIIDTGPDFRQQMLQHDVNKITAILFTHEHKDHVAGLDDVRAFNFISGRPVDVYAEERVQKSLRREFGYIFSEEKYPGIPQINMHILENKPFYIEDMKIIPVRACHHNLTVFGFRLGSFAYLTDIKSVPVEEKKKLENLDTMVITALRKEEHFSHMNLDEALDFIAEINPKRTYLTHLSHSFGLHEREEKQLPPNVFIAYDGLILSFGKE